MRHLVLTERQIQRAVMDHWRAFGLPGTLVAAVPNAGALGQHGLCRGLFDLVVMGGDYLRDRTGWLELKTHCGRLSADQKAFRQRCIDHAIPYAVAYGRDEPILVLEAWRVVRPAPALPLTVEAA